MKCKNEINLELIIINSELLNQQPLRALRETITKLTKLVYVYKNVDVTYLGSYSTVQGSKEYNMGKDTLSKYLLKREPFKGKILSRIKLHNS